VQARLPGSPALAAALVQLARPRRYAALDLYGLAAGLATSWAALVASRPDAVNNSWATDILYYCAALLQTVRPPPARPAPGRGGTAPPPLQAARRAGGRALVRGGRVPGLGRGDNDRRPGAVPPRPRAGVCVAGQRLAGPARARVHARLGRPQRVRRRALQGARRRAPLQPRAPAAGAGGPDPRPLQLLLSTARLYDGLHAAGTGPHAGPHVAFLKAFCSAGSGDLLVLVLQPCVAVAGAPAGRPSGGTPAWPSWPSWPSKGKEGCSHTKQGAL